MTKDELLNWPAGYKTDTGELVKFTFGEAISEAGLVLMPVDGFKGHTYISELQANMREGRMTERRRCAEIVRRWLDQGDQSSTGDAMLSEIEADD